MAKFIREILIRREEIAAMCQRLGEKISADYADREVILIGVLKGAYVFMADLARHLTIPCRIDFMSVSSYGSGTRSSGVVRITKDLDMDITGSISYRRGNRRHGVDTQHLRQCSVPESGLLCRLQAFDKPERRKSM
jgi:hypoxanthine phosphoribosyltransferase